MCKKIRNKKHLVASLVMMLVLWYTNTPLLAMEGEEGAVFIEREFSKEEEQKFSMEFRDADLKDVLRAISQENQVNIIISEEVEGKLTLSFKDVSLENAFEAILKNNNLMAMEEGGVVRVFKSPFKEGEENMTTRIIRINFADVRESQSVVVGFLSKQGTLSVDPRTNTIIVRDIPEIADRIQTVLKTLDTRTPQVLIEARIVEASTTFARELGVQWGGSITNNVSDGAYEVTGATDATGTDALTEGVGLSGENSVVNLPATVGTGSGGALGFSFGSLDGMVQLDLQLSALEDSGHGRVLSKPSILALDNRVAVISAGEEIKIPVTTIATGISTGSADSSGGITSGVTTIDAKLELEVTPHVTPDGLVVMSVRAEKKEADFSRAVDGIPTLVTRTVKTDLLVKDGETIVIGGIETRSESVSESGIPWLSKIPLLGWLFKKETKRDDRRELLIFITPTIQR